MTISRVELPETREEITVWALGVDLLEHESYARTTALELVGGREGITSNGTYGLEEGSLAVYVSEIQRIQKWAYDIKQRFPELTESKRGLAGNNRIHIAGVYII